MALLYPGPYRLAMSNLGFQYLYAALNSQERILCERAFLPDRDELSRYEGGGVRLFTIESLRPVRDFDVAAFSIAFEDDYANVPFMLELSGIEPLAERREGAPLVVAGGVAVTLNPEPTAPFMDLFHLGEAEGAAVTLFERIREALELGASRAELLSALAGLDGVYVPSLYDFGYAGPVVSTISPRPGAPARVRAVKNLDLRGFEPPRTAVLTPETEFSSMSLVEIERGCGRGCRFCAAGFVYLPPRMREEGDVAAAIDAGIDAAGRVGLVGAAVSEYPAVKDLLRRGAQRGAGLTLSSVRADMIDAELVGLLGECGLRTLAMAPEAGSARLRNVINKGMDDETLVRAAALAGEGGIGRLRLYFMVGLPTETDDDARAAAELALRMKAAFGKGDVTVSINPFVPKPVTPFQWSPFESAAVMERRLSIIKDALRAVKGVALKVESPRRALFQAALARGDRRLAAALAAVSRLGWRGAFREAGLDPAALACRPREREELFPWSLIDHGVTDDYLWKEYCRALSEQTTPPCSVGRCTRCGVCR